MFKKKAVKGKSVKDNNALILLIVVGFAGSGKSTLAKRLSKDLNFSLVDKDTASRPFTDFILKQNGTGPHDRESEFYVKQVRDLEYRVCYDICKENLALNNSIIFAAPFLKEVKNYKEFSNSFGIGFFDTLNVKVKLISIKHFIDVEKCRILERNAIRDRNKIDNWEEYASTIKDFSIDSDFDSFIYDNSGEINEEDQLEGVKKWIYE